jgi:hypothetical protein
MNTATKALDFEPKSGEEVPKDIFERESGALRLTARMTLEEWRKGHFRFSWV